MCRVSEICMCLRLSQCIGRTGNRKVAYSRRHFDLCFMAIFIRFARDFSCWSHLLTYVLFSSPQASYLLVIVLLIFLLISSWLLSSLLFFYIFTLFVRFFLASLRPRLCGVTTFLLFVQPFVSVIPSPSSSCPASCGPRGGSDCGPAEGRRTDSGVVVSSRATETEEDSVNKVFYI